MTTKTTTAKKTTKKPATKKSTPAKAAPTPSKWKKGSFYLDRSNRLWQCADSKPYDQDGDEMVKMRAAFDGTPEPDAGLELASLFGPRMTPAEVKEYREVCQRELEAEGAAVLAQAEEEEADEAAPVAPEPEPTKPSRKPKAATTGEPDAPKAAKRMSALDAAAKVLYDSNVPMNAKELIAEMESKGYWTSPGGQTPHATLYAAMVREINTKGTAARFSKSGPGHFTWYGSPATPATPATKKTTKAKEITDGAAGPKAVSDLFRM